MSGPLSNPRWEAFCQHMVHGDEPGVATAAYRNAGYEAKGAAAWAAASRLSKRPEIRARIEELRNGHRHREAGT